MRFHRLCVVVLALSGSAGQATAEVIDYDTTIDYTIEEEIGDALKAFLIHLKGNMQDAFKDKPVEIEAFTSITDKDYYLLLLVVFYRTGKGLLATVQAAEIVSMNEYLDAVSEFMKDGSTLMEF